MWNIYLTGRPSRTLFYVESNPSVKHGDIMASPDDRILVVLFLVNEHGYEYLFATGRVPKTYEGEANNCGFRAPLVGIFSPIFLFSLRTAMTIDRLPRYVYQPEVITIDSTNNPSTTCSSFSHVTHTNRRPSPSTAPTTNLQHSRFSVTGKKIQSICIERVKPGSHPDTMTTYPTGCSLQDWAVALTRPIISV